MSERMRIGTKATEAKKENSISRIQIAEVSHSMDSPVEQVLSLQRTIGNQAVQRLIKSGALQAKLKIGMPGDRYEQEADRVAEQVVSSISPIQNKCKATPCPLEDEENKLMKRKTATSDASVNSVADNFIQNLGSGQPLDIATRAYFEPRFGTDFSQVRVHADWKAAESARAMNALAYTVGRNVVFGESRYVPERVEGRRLLAHELTHTIQQQSGPNPTSDPKSAIESEADRISHAVVAGTIPTSPHLRTTLCLARQTRTPNSAELSDAELQAEYEQVRMWLLKHSMIELNYPSTLEYFATIEKEVWRRNASKGGNWGAPIVSVPSGGKPIIPVPANIPDGGLVAETTSRPAPMTAAHAGGVLGERDIAFALGKRGFHFVISPSGPGAHLLTASGFDSIAYNPMTGEIWLIDNKASGAVGNIEGKKATALGGKNLETNLNVAVRTIRGMAEFPNKAVVLRKLEDSLTAVRNGQPISSDVKLKVTNAGGYAGGARNLPRGVELEDVVGSAVRQARRADIAAAKEEGISSGRPKSHVETEAMRQRIGGVQTKEPVRMPVRTRIARNVRSIGGGIVKIAAVQIWNYLMTKLEQYIESKVTQYLIEQKMKVLEPTIAARLNDQIRVMVDLQLRQPGKPLFGIIGLLTTIERCSEEELCDLEVELTAVDISTEKIEPKNEQSRIWIGFDRKPTTPPPSFGPQFKVAIPRDLIRTTYSVELEPLSKDQLHDILLEDIAAEEFTVSESSLMPEQLLASQRRREELSAQVHRLESM